MSEAKVAKAKKRGKREAANVHIRLSCDTAGSPFAANPFQISTMGMISDSTDSLDIIYNEILPEVMMPVQTRIEICGERITAYREFPLHTVVVFEKNRMYQSSYEMPHGFALTRILTDNIEVTRDEGAGSARVSFQMGSGGNMLHYKYDIKYSKIADKSGMRSA